MDKKTILIVEDNPDTRLQLNALLRANHYHTVFAADALRAYSWLLKSGLMQFRLIWVSQAGVA